MIISLFLLLLKLQSLLQLTVSSSSLNRTSPIAKLNCSDHCGNVEIPHPFGIGAGCYYNESYAIICNTSFSPPKPFLYHFNLEILDINWPGRYSKGDILYDQDLSEQILLVGNIVQNICTSHGGDPAEPVDLRNSPYRFSRWYNVFVVSGCGVNAVLKNRDGDIVTGCASMCMNDTSMTKSSNCFGVECCQATVLSSSPTDDYFGRSADLDFYEIVSSSQTCNVTAGLLDIYSMTNFSGSLSSPKLFPTVLEWRTADIAPSESFSCNNWNRGRSQRCLCEDYKGYKGNPYLPNGCQLVKECQKCKHGCAFYRTNDSTTSYYYCEKHSFLKLSSILGFGISTGFVMLLLGCYWLYRLGKRIKAAKQKAKNFKRNGGLLLQQQISSRDGIVDKTIIFTLCELEKATDNFSEDRILGQGGQGTVYKGMLEDGSIVAIKKSKMIDKNQLEQFINELVILSLVNHRSVVKLLGCCLETEVPSLVYEFIPNGTLYQHLHDPSDDFHITWRMRLQIASESASALTYLHSSSSVPIYHRDIKSSNILLDDKYKAKVSDFGTSRAITIEQTHVTTCVQGTYGYLDPEYFQSNQFTEKSDVYSFGVVLVELLTGKKPIFPTTSGGWMSLATEFLFQMENSCLFENLDPRISEEVKNDELIEVANLARQCLNMKGKQRPTMKEVNVLLEAIRSPHMSKPTESKCLESEFVAMEYNSPCNTETSFFDCSSCTSWSIEGMPLMSGN
ncbi:unnamed protein product [Amaranthus hypochondriacus]